MWLQHHEEEGHGRQNSSNELGFNLNEMGGH